MSRKASSTGGEIINTKVFYIRSQDGKNFGKNVDGGKVTTAFDVVLDEPIQCEPHQVMYASLNDIQLPWSWFSTDRTNNQFVVMMQFNAGFVMDPYAAINWGQDGSTYVQRYVLSADQFPYDPTRPLPTMVRPSTNAARSGGVVTYARHGNTPPVAQVGNAFCCQDVREIPKGNYTPLTFAAQIQTMLNRPWAEGGFADVGYNLPAAPTNQFYVTYNQQTNSLFFGLQYTDTGLSVNNSFGSPNVLGPRVYLIWNDLILPNGTGGYYGDLAAAQGGEVYGDPQSFPGWFFPASPNGTGTSQLDPDAGLPGTGIPFLGIQPFNIYGPERPAFSQFGFGPKGNILPILNPNNSKIENRPSNWKMDANIGGGFIILNFPPLLGGDWWSYGNPGGVAYLPRTPPDTPNMQAFRANFNYPGGFQFWGSNVPTDLDSQFYFTPAVMDWYGERHRCVYVRTSMTSARSHSTRLNNRTDIIAKIPVQKITDTDAENIHNNDMVTYGKEENMGIKLDAKVVQSMRIELTDGNGLLIDLNGLDWTLSIRFDISWKPSYVMWNGGRRKGETPDGIWTDPQDAAHHRIMLMREYGAWRNSQKPVPPPEEKRDRSKEEGNKPASLTAEREERKEAVSRGWVKERPAEDEEARQQIGLT